MQVKCSYLSCLLNQGVAEVVSKGNTSWQPEGSASAEAAPADTHLCHGCLGIQQCLRSCSSLVPRNGVSLFQALVLVGPSPRLLCLSMLQLQDRQVSTWRTAHVHKNTFVTLCMSRHSDTDQGLYHSHGLLVVVGMVDKHGPSIIGRTGGKSAQAKCQAHTHWQILHVVSPQTCAALTSRQTCCKRCSQASRQA